MHTGKTPLQEQYLRQIRFKPLSGSKCAWNSAVFQAALDFGEGIARIDGISTSKMDSVSEPNISLCRVRLLSLQIERLARLGCRLKNFILTFHITHSKINVLGRRSVSVFDHFCSTYSRRFRRIPSDLIVSRSSKDALRDSPQSQRRNSNIGPRH